MSGDDVTYGDLASFAGNDALTFKASNEYAGVTLNYNPMSTVKANDDLWKNGNGVEYTAFVNPTPWLQLKLGAHKDGIFYAEQAKNDTDNSNWGSAGRYAFLYKLGVITKNSSGYALDDMTSYQIGATPFLFADFKFDNVGPGNLLLRASFASTGIEWLVTGGFHDKSVKTAPGLMVAYKIKDLIDVNLDAQMVTNNDLAAGLYVSPLMVKGSSS